MAVNELVASIIQFLTKQLENRNITEDSLESLEVAIQCLESAFNVQASDAPANVDLLALFSSSAVKASPEAKAQAEALKNEGNSLMKAEKYQEALNNYTQAIKLDSQNAVYYGNRAAVHSKLGNFSAAIQDCQTALSIEPTYGKAYGRLGIAYSGLNRHKEAREAYQKALELEPDNESYKSNLQLTEEKLGQSRPPGFRDLNSLLTNPALMNMARQMMFEPEMQDLMRNIIGNNADARMEALGSGRLPDAILEAGQRLAQTLQNSNPEVIETLQRHMDDSNDADPSQKS